MMQPQKEDVGKMTANKNHDVEQLCAKPLEEKEIKKEIVSANSNENDDLQVTIQEPVSDEPNEERDDDQEQVSTNTVDPQVTVIEALLSAKPSEEREDDKVQDRAKTDEPQAIEIDMNQGDHIALVSTITQSTTDASYKEILRDYSITRDQKLNKMSKEVDGESFVKLRKDIMKEISDNLKTMMIMKAQVIGLSIKDKKNQTRGVKTYTCD